MPGKGQIILDVAINDAQIAAFEKRALAAAQNIQKAMSGAFGVSGGGSRGSGGSRRGGGSASGGAGGGLSAEEKTVLRQERRTASPERKAEIEFILALDRVKGQAATRELQRLHKLELAQIGAANANKKASNEYSKATRQVEHDLRAQDTAVLKSLKGVEKLRYEWQMALRGVQSPQAIEAINQSYQRRIAAANIPQTANNAGFMSNFMSGFGRAGGMGSALATVIKYGAAYKAVEITMNSILAPARLTAEFLNRGADAWLKYEDAMAKAQRTMQMPGMKTDVIKDAFRPEILSFLGQYRTTIEDVSTAIYELGSAGADASEVMMEWQPVVKLNIALQGDMTETARTLTQILKIHNVDMGKDLSDRQKMILLSGVVAKTWQIEQLELTDLASAYKYVAANAATLKVKAQELIPLIGFMSTYGLRGSIGGTGLNQFLTQLGRTIKVTKDGLIEIQKTTRGGIVTIQTGVKAGDVQGPIQMFAALARAAKSQPNAKWIDELGKSGMFADIFNIRGGRPALLVLQKFDEFMKRVGDTSSMTAKQAEEFVQSLVDMQQNTPQAQMDLLNAKIDIAGQRFLTAAVGADTFTGALKNINAWVDSIAPKIEQFGTKIRGAFAFWSQNPILHPIKAAQAQNKVEADAIASRARNEAARVYLRSGGSERAVYQWIRSEQSKIKSKYNQPASVDALGHLLTAPRAPYADTFYGEVVAGKAARKRGDYGAAADILIGRYIALSDIKNNIGSIVDVASTLKSEAAGRTPAGPAPGTGITKGSRGASTNAREYRDAIQIILDGLIKYEDATAIVTESLRRQDIEEQKLARSTGGRLITNAHIKQSDELVAAQIKVNADLIEALNNEQQQLASAQRDLGRVSKAPDESTRSKAQHALSQVMQKMFRNETAIAEAKDKQDQARERGASLRIAQIMQMREREATAYARNGRAREEILRRDQQAIEAIDRTEKLYGETLASQSARVAVLAQQSDHLAAGRERDEARLSKLRTQYDALTSAIEGMEKTGKFNPESLNGAFSADTVSAIEKSKDVYGDLRELYDKTAGDVDSLTASIDGSTRTILDNAAAIEMLNKVMGVSGYATKLDAATLAMERSRDLIESQGRDWTTSAERVQAATEIYDTALAIASEKLFDLDMEMHSGTLTPEEYQKQWEEIMAAPSKAANEALFRIPYDLRKAKEAILYEIEDMTAGWDLQGERTGNKAILAIERKVKAMREQYAANPEMLALVGSYEATAKADVMMQKWLKRREEIEQAWSQAFMQFFSELSSDSKDAVRNLLQSIIGSLQQQIIDQFLRQALEGVFDTMATTMTGIDPATIALGQFTMALNAATGALSALSNGAGISPLMDALGGAQGTSGGSGAYLSMLSGNSPSVLGWIGATGLLGAAGAAVAAGMGGGPSGAMIDAMAPPGTMVVNGQIIPVSQQGKQAMMGSFMGIPGIAASPLNGKFGWKWAAGSSTLGKALGGAAYGGIAGSISGALLGKDPATSSTNGMIGGAIGGMIGGPVGAAIGGFIGGLFGPSKKTPPPSREIYGMPTFEWESYLYRFSESNRPLSNRERYQEAKGDRNVTININGGDETKVRRVVNEELTSAFGNTAVASARRGSIYQT